MEPQPVTVIVRYRALPEQAERAERELRELVTTVIDEPECLGIEMHRDPDDPTRIQLLERWADGRVYLGAHMRTPHLQAFMGRARDFLAGPPEISIWRVDATYGSPRAEGPKTRSPG